LNEERQKTAARRVGFLERCLDDPKSYEAIVASGRFLKLTSALSLAQEQREASARSFGRL
jgi:hypothetical protein